MVCHEHSKVPTTGTYVIQAPTGCVFCDIEKARAIAEQARRFVLASDTYDTRDWDTFEAEELGAVTTEYVNLRKLVLEGPATPATSEDPKR